MSDTRPDWPDRGDEHQSPSFLLSKPVIPAIKARHSCESRNPVLMFRNDSALARMDSCFRRNDRGSVRNDRGMAGNVKQT